MAIERVTNSWGSALHLARQLEIAATQAELRKQAGATPDATPKGVVDQIKSQSLVERFNKPAVELQLSGTATPNEASPLNQTSVRTGFTPTTEARATFRTTVQGQIAGNSVVNQAADEAQPGLPNDQTTVSMFFDPNIFNRSPGNIVKALQRESGVRPQ